MTAPCVLLVDDEPEIVATLKSILVSRGYDVVCAYDAEQAEAILVAKRDPPIGVILSDINLPGKSGISLLSEARARDHDLEVILMSGAPSLETAAAAVRLGAFDYVTKPVSGFRVADLVAQAFAKRDERRSSAEALHVARERIGALEVSYERRSRELRESDARYRQLIEGLDIVVFEFDLTSNRFTYVGGRLATTLGLVDAVPTDRDLFARFVPEDRARIREIFESAAPSDFRLLRGEARMLAADGRTLYVRIVTAPPSDEAPRLLPGFVVDVTERTLVEMERARLESELERAREELRRSLITELHLPDDRPPITVLPVAPAHESTLEFGASPAMDTVRRLAEVARTHEEPVLIYGETGTGKGVLAEWIHRSSTRAGRPFVSLNCATLRPEFVASELFGHAKGAFTSAVRDRRGLVEEAEGGTLFLDEIGELATDVQGQLLKVLEEKTFRRMGESKVRRSEFRLICATHRDLTRAAEEGRFRADLLYRIEVLPIHLPALRDRVGDLPVIASRLLAQAGIGHVEVGDETFEFLARHSWPGNLRELRNSLIRATLLSGGKTLRPEHFVGIVRSVGSGRADLVSAPPTPPTSTPPSVQSQPPSEETGDERARILALLERFDGNRAKVARALGIARSSLYRKLTQYGIER